MFDPDGELCSKISIILTKEKFNGNGSKLGSLFVNKRRMLYSELQNRLYILETDENGEYYLWDFSFQIAGILKDVKYSKIKLVFMNEEDKEIKMNGLVEFFEGENNNLLGVECGQQIFGITRKS
jgi:hypothetical protein